VRESAERSLSGAVVINNEIAPRARGVGSVSLQPPSCKTKNKSTFSVPKDDILLNLWEKSIGFKLKPTSRICELHFEIEDVIKTA